MDLFSGFQSRKQSDQQVNIIKEIIEKNPEKYRTVEPDYDNENIMEQSITEED